MSLSSRTVEVSEKSIEDCITAWLYAAGELNDNEDVVSLEQGTAKWDEGMKTFLIPIKLEIKQNRRLTSRIL